MGGVKRMIDNVLFAATLLLLMGLAAWLVVGTMVSKAFDAG
jgi:hypothetical protein